MKLKDFLFKMFFLFLTLAIIFFLFFKLGIISFNSKEIPIVFNLSHDEIGMKVGSVYRLSFSTYTKNDFSNMIEWKSSDPTIAQVSQTGVVKALKKGKVVIKSRLKTSELYDECVIDVSENDILIQSVEIDNNKVNLQVDSEYKLQYSLLPSNTTMNTFYFTSSDQSIVTVTNEGIIKGISEGYAVVTINSYYGNIQDKIYVQVFNKNTSITKIEDDHKINLNVGGGYSLESLCDLNCYINWNSTNKRIINVNDGIIRGLKLGKAYVVGTNIDGTTSVIEVVVRKEKVLAKDIIIEDKKIILELGSTQKINAQVIPKASTDQLLIFKSNNKDIFEVDNRGNIIGKEVGIGTLSITLEDGRLYKEVPIEVIKNSNEVVEKLNFSSTNLSIKIGNTLNLSSLTNIDSKYIGQINWQSSNQDIVSCNKDGLIEGLKSGKAIIKATTPNGITSTITINVEQVPVSGISLNENKKTLKVGKTTTLILAIIPNNASNKNIVWSTDDKNVAIVDQYGTITGIKQGKTVITATIEDKKTNMIIEVIN